MGIVFSLEVLNAHLAWGTVDVQVLCLRLLLCIADRRRDVLRSMYYDFFTRYFDFGGLVDTADRHHTNFFVNSKSGTIL